MFEPARRLLTILIVSSPLVLGADALAGQEAAQAQGDTMRLSLGEAIRLAFEQNLDIAVVDFDRAIARQNSVAASGAFDPVFRFGSPGGIVQSGAAQGFGGSGTGPGGIGFISTQSPATNQLAGADVLESDTVSTVASFSHLLDTGLSYDVSYRVSRSTTNSGFTNLNPSFDNTLAFSVTQPLLRGRGEESAAAQLLLSRRNEEVAAAAFRVQVETILDQVLNAYWQVVFTARDVEVKEQSLQLAREQLERTRAHVEVGMVAPVQETQAQAAVAARRGDLIVARSSHENAVDDLRAALRAERLPAGWETEIVAVDQPEVTPRQVDLAAAERDALEQRPEIARARASIAARRVDTDAARDALLPQLDLVGTLSFTGIGGDLLVREGFFGDPIDVIPGGYADAAEQLFSFDVPTWGLGVNFSMPIGNNRAEGGFARATLAEDKARLELERVEQQVVLDVRKAARRLAEAAELIESSRLARELAVEQLAVEQDRFDVGMSTNFEILEFQDDLARARSAELRAMIDYRLAEAALARATGRLLDDFGIALR